MFKLRKTNCNGCFEVITTPFCDDRGKLVKIHHEESLLKLGLNANFEESYYSVSKQGVLRGLHFQQPPAAQIKLVSCVSGIILDVVVDLRKNSDTYKNVFAVELSSKKANMLYVPEGFAHGFYTLSKEAIFISYNSKKYVPEFDAGIRWDSIGFDWPDSSPIISKKDANLPEL